MSHAKELFLLAFFDSLCLATGRMTSDVIKACGTADSPGDFATPTTSFPVISVHKLCIDVFLCAIF